MSIPREKMPLRFYSLKVRWNILTRKSIVLCVGGIAMRKLICLLIFDLVFLC